MNLMLVIIVMAILLASTIILYRDFMSPAILMLIPWLLSFVLLKYSDFYYAEVDDSYAYILIGIILFQVAYFLSLKRKKNVDIYAIGKKKDILYKELNINGTFIVSVSIIETIILLIYELKLLKGSDTILVFEYVHQIAITLFAIILYLYFKLPKTYKNKMYLFVQMVPFAIALLLKTNGRAAYFQVAFMLLFIYLSFNEYNNFLILKRFIQIFLICVALFIYVAIRKNHIEQGNIEYVLEQAVNWIIHYISGSLVTFQKWFKTCENEFQFGQNTFRIFFAIANRFISSHIQVVSTYFPFMKIGPRIESIANVYTIYYTYIIDFGKVGGLIFQGVLGWIYGYLYWKKESNQMGAVLAFAFLIYPLVMQVFGDQYVALESGYLQIFLVYFIVHKCGFLYKKKNKMKIRYLKF